MAYVNIKILAALQEKNSSEIPMGLKGASDIEGKYVAVEAKAGPSRDADFRAIGIPDEINIFN